MPNPFAHTSVVSAAGPPSMASGPAGGNGVSFTQAREEIGAGMSGRISLAMLNSIVLAMVLFYIWTRNAQGGS
jgi:hypothetical protein